MILMKNAKEKKKMMQRKRKMHKEIQETPSNILSLRKDPVRIPPMNLKHLLRDRKPVKIHHSNFSISNMLLIWR
jgi:hypothetical protein